jgi:hypothetical protein
MTNFCLKAIDALMLNIAINTTEFPEFLKLKLNWTYDDTLKDLKLNGFIISYEYCNNKTVFREITSNGIT